MERSGSVSPSEVADGLYRGWNRARLSSLLRARKFLKRFHPPDADGRVWGENVLARQNAIAEPWRPRFDGRGLLPFAVLPPGSGANAGWPHALVISYGAWPGRTRLNPVSRVVDYVVRPNPARPGLLLGASYFDTGGLGAFLEYFLLERV